MAAKKAPKPPPPVRIPKRPTPIERIPHVIVEPTLDDHLAVISKAVFQAGLSWAFIDERWHHYVAAFDGFAAASVAAYGEADVERLLSAEGVIRSRSKILGTIHNARALLEIVRDFGTVDAYHRSFAAYDDARKDVAKRLKFMGDLNVYYWRFRTNATVPAFEEWIAAQQRDHPRMREMVAAAGRHPTSA